MHDTETTGLTEFLDARREKASITSLKASRSSGSSEKGIPWFLDQASELICRTNCAGCFACTLPGDMRSYYGDSEPSATLFSAEPKSIRHGRREMSRVRQQRRWLLNTRNDMPVTPKKCHPPREVRHVVSMIVYIRENGDAIGTAPTRNESETDLWIVFQRISFPFDIPGIDFQETRSHMSRGWPTSLTDSYNAQHRRISQGLRLISTIISKCICDRVCFPGRHFTPRCWNQEVFRES